jgi:hypothetical protein
VSGDADQGSAAVQDRLRTVEQAVRRLTDLEEVRGLTAEYQRLCDGGWDGPSHPDPDALTRLFTEDAEYALPDMPVCRGAAEIRARFEGLQPGVPWIIHFVANPEFEVDGDRATGRIKGAACYFRNGERHLTFGTYFGDFTRTAQGWRFASWRFVRAQPPELRPW